MIPASARQAIVIRFSTFGPWSVSTVPKSAYRRSCALSETGYAAPRRPMLVSWGARALYVGPGFGLSPHRNAVAILAIGLDGPLEIAKDARRPSAGFHHCRTALIEPNQLHFIQIAGSDCAFLYVDALSRDLASLRRRCRRPGPAVCMTLDGEEDLIALLAGMDRSADGWRGVSSGLAAALCFESSRPDQRIAAAVDNLLSAPALETDTAALAARAVLSVSRFQHLFKATTGVPVRRFRLWARMRRAIGMAVAGATLTHAALEAGFSSPAHFAAAFREMFGMAPTQFLAVAPIFVETESRCSTLAPPDATRSVRAEHAS
jgi:AraC-like DNA-binding protein